MNSHQPPHAEPRASAPDELDRLLSDHFRREMPHPWPVAPSTNVEPASRQSYAPGPRSRWVLAASVMLVLGLCWVGVRSTAPVGTPRGSAAPGTAGDGPILQEMQKQRTITDTPKP